MTLALLYENIAKATRNDDGHDLVLRNISKLSTKTN